MYEYTVNGLITPISVIYDVSVLIELFILGWNRLGLWVFLNSFKQLSQKKKN